MADGRESVEISRKHGNGVLTPRRDIMNQLTGKDEQPNAMANTRKERLPCVGILKKSSVVAGN